MWRWTFHPQTSYNFALETLHWCRHRQTFPPIHFHFHQPFGTKDTTITKTLIIEIFLWKAKTFFFSFFLALVPCVSHLCRMSQTDGSSETCGHIFFYTNGVKNILFSGFLEPRRGTTSPLAQLGPLSLHSPLSFSDVSVVPNVILRGATPPSQ